MSWMFSIWATGALLTVCRGENTLPAGRGLSASGYHLCVENKTRTVTFLAVHEVPFSVTRPCGGWLLWKTCTVTEYRLSHQTEYKTVSEQETSCCHGYVQVGRYCAPSLNRSGELIVKPGSCPATNGSHPGSQGCQWDVDCPGWLKCCQGANHSICSEPTRSTNHFEERGRNRFNATVIVKTDYDELVSQARGLLNHTRLLHAMVVGAIQWNVSIRYMESWPVYPYRTATVLLLSCTFDLSLHNVTSKLYLLPKHIKEVSAVTVEDIDECKQPTLHHCPPSAECNNTLGSYQCICHHGYVDADPSKPGAGCRAESTRTYTDTPLTFSPTTNTSNRSASSTADYPQGNNSTDNRRTTAPSTHVLTASTPASTTESQLSTSACSSPSVSRLWSANVTGTSFCVCWSSQAQTSQVYRVVVEKGPEVLHVWETTENTMAVLGLGSGVLYTITVTPRECGRQGQPVRIAVRTDAVTLEATARLTNIRFTADLQDTGSQAYRNLTESILAEIYRSLSPEVRVMWDSQQARVEIRGFSSGSVVVNLLIIFIPGDSRDILNASGAIVGTLMNTTKYTVDSTNMTDFNECAPGGNDCSLWATCTNTWASYTCACLVGFIDHQPERPGRACQADNTTFTPPTSTIDSPAWNHFRSTEATDVTTAAPESSGSWGNSATSASLVFSRTASTTAAGFPQLPSTVVPASTKAAATTTTGLKTAPAVPTGAISVQCRGAAITVSVARDFLLSACIEENSLYLGLLGCGVNGGSATHAQLTVAWSECNTRLVHNESHYMASVTLFNTVDQNVLPSGVTETPKIHLEVPIMCAYEKSMLISADFGSMGYELFKDIIVGSGFFLVRVRLTNGTAPLPQNHSLSSDEVVVVDVSLNTTLDQIKVVINRCWVTPTQNPRDTYSYIFMENSCSLNAYTKVLTNGNSSTSRVSVQIFSFVDLSVIYLHCRVQICAQIGLDSCVPDCSQRTSRSSGNTIATALGSSGPLLKSSEETLENGNNTLQLIGLSCLGVLIAIFFIIVIVSLLYYQRNRIGHYNFNVNPKQENFTSLG